MRNRETGVIYESVLDYVTREYDYIHRDLYYCLICRQIDEHEIEDHISDGFERLVRHHHKYKGVLTPIHMRRWVRRVVLNVMFKKFSMSNRRTRLRRGMCPPEVCTGRSTEAEAESRITYDNIRVKVSEMSPSYRKCFDQLTGVRGGKRCPTITSRLRKRLSTHLG